MWIIPRNYQLFSVFAQDMVESKEELNELSGQLEHSLMWRSKPTQFKTWLRRWKTLKWLPALCGRMLKPSQWKRFEEKLTSLLEDIPVSHSQQQESDKEQMTQGTFGPTSEGQLSLLDLPCASLRMSKGIYRLDSPQLSATWKKMVTQQRGEYSARLKLAHRTREKECLSLRTPNEKDCGDVWPTVQCSMGAQNKSGGKVRWQLPQAVKAWPTATSRDWKGCGPNGRIRGGGEAGRHLGSGNTTLWPARPGEDQYEWEEPRVI